MKDLELPADADEDILRVSGFFFFEKIFKSIASASGVGRRGVQGIDADDEGVARARGRRFGERGEIVDWSSGVARKRRDVLLHAVFENLEIFGGEAGYLVAFLVGHYDGHEDLLDVETDYGFLGERGPG